MGEKEAKVLYEKYEKKEKEIRAKMRKLNTDCNKKRRILEKQLGKISDEKKEKEIRAKMRKLNTDCNKKRCILEKQLGKISDEKFDNMYIAYHK